MNEFHRQERKRTNTLKYVKWEIQNAYLWDYNEHIQNTHRQTCKNDILLSPLNAFSWDRLWKEGETNWGKEKKKQNNPP